MHLKMEKNIYSRKLSQHFKGMYERCLKKDLTIDHFFGTQTLEYHGSGRVKFLIKLIRIFIFFCMTATLLRATRIFMHFIPQVDISTRVCYFGEVGIFLTGNVYFSFAIFCFTFYLWASFILFCVYKKEHLVTGVVTTALELSSFDLNCDSSFYIKKLETSIRRSDRYIVAHMMLSVGLELVFLGNEAVKYYGQYNINCYIGWTIVAAVSKLVHCFAGIRSLIFFKIHASNISLLFKIINKNLKILAQKSNQGSLSWLDKNLFYHLIRSHIKVCEGKQILSEVSFHLFHDPCTSLVFRSPHPALCSE